MEIPLISECFEITLWGHELQIQIIMEKVGNINLLLNFTHLFFFFN